MNRKLSFALLMLLFMLSSAAFAPVFADELELASIRTPGSTQCGVIILTSDSGSTSCPPSGIRGLTSRAVAMGDLTNGIFGVDAFIDNTSGKNLNDFDTSEAFLTVNYVFTV